MAGKDKNGHGYVLADISGRYPPTEWARLAIAADATHRADRIVAEVNNGGDMRAGRTGGGALPAGPRSSHRHLPATRPCRARRGPR